MQFANKLINWYQGYKRDLPWRNTRNAYYIWLSEIILQQTRVEQGLPYYQRYVKNYPTLESLAKASEDEVLKLWQGLGYYSRARNMLATARLLVNEYKGKFPETAAELTQLKGIGPYTAAAIASFAFNEPVPVVDGNVFRVLSRYLGIDEPINSSRARKIFTEAAMELLDKKRPADFNQAIMEFGATWCKPGKPDCANCLFNTSCFAFTRGSVQDFPVKNAKAKQKIRYFNYLLVNDKHHTWLHKREEADIWQNLWQLPLIESKTPLEIEELVHDPAFQVISNGHLLPQPNFVEQKHILTHQVIYARFWKTDLSKHRVPPPAGYLRVALNQLSAFAIPRILDIYLKKINLV